MNVKDMVSKYQMVLSYTQLFLSFKSQNKDVYVLWTLEITCALYKLIVIYLV